MSRRKAFWGDEGVSIRQVPNLVNGQLVDFAVNRFGVRFLARSNGEQLRFIPWSELHRISQLPEPINAANALYGELREPRILPVEDDGA